MTVRANRTGTRMKRAAPAITGVAMIGVAMIGAGALLAPVSGARADGYTPVTNYILRCAGCHSMDGSGHPVGGIPDFRGTIGAFMNDDGGRTYVVRVPGVAGAGLTAAETAAVLNLVVANWAGESKPADFRPFTEAEVAERRTRPVTDVVVLRREVAARLVEQGLPMADYPWP